MWDRVRLFFVHRLLELAGVVLILASVAGLVALYSYHPGDPSANTATAEEPRNLMGLYGAWFADMALQVLGIGCLAFVIPLGVYGVWLVRKTHPPLLWARGICWLFAIAAAAALAAHLPLTPPERAVPAGWGGVLGAWLADGIKDALILLNLFGEAQARVIGAIVYFLTLVAALSYALGLRIRHVKAAYESARHSFSQGRDFVGGAVFKVRSLLPERLREVEALPPAGGKRSTLKDTLQSMPGRAEAAEKKQKIVIDPVVPRAAEKAAAAAEAKRAAKISRNDAALDLAREPANYNLPPLSLLAKPKASDRAVRLADAQLQEKAQKLENVLQEFGVKGQILNVRPGPVITLYEFEPAPGIKSARVIGLSDDIARSMSAVSSRVAVIPGRNVIGIELPNEKRETVYLRELLSADEYEKTNERLSLALGKTIGGEPVIADLANMPHLLIAGTTGSGKSVAINTMILSLLFRLPPSKCRMIMIDPKMLELSVYEGIPHLLTPVVTDPKKAVVALKWTVREMEDRYRKMSKLGVRNIAGYNERVFEALKSGETLTRKVQTGFDRETGRPIYESENLPAQPMPFIVVVVDEMADLMMVAGKDIEGAVQRLAQMARAAGIHLITATQRPSVDVVTGTIKANFPTRISFQVTSKVDSRTILGEQGAEHLLGRGDMLHMAGGGRLQRLHGPFVSDDEVENVVAFLKKQGAPEYVAEVLEEPDEDPLQVSGGGGDGSDDLYDQAVAIVLRDRKASTSYVQRKLQIGYNRAANLIERMEEEGVVSQPNNAGKREVLVGDH